MVLMNLLAGQQLRKKLMDMGEGRRGRMRCIDRVTWKLTIPYVK